MLIAHDFHIHTTLSLCAKDESATVANYVRNARRQGLKRLGFANHMWDSAIPGATEWYQAQDYAHVAQIKEELKREAEQSDIQLFFGCEAEYDYIHRGIALTEEVAARFDFILVPNSHTHMVMPKEYYLSKARHARFMLDAFMDIVSSPLAQYVTTIAHPFSAVCCPYDNRTLYTLISAAQYQEAFSAAQEADIALEINTNCFSTYTLQEIADHPALEMLSLAKQRGCKFIFGSDAHSAKPGMLQDSWRNAYVLASLLDIQADDLARMACV
ncbi:PHP domain-containing protein [Eubacteriales bacterium OttesenSCG-928-A19]|nr:PHP domain-containing protein [Eubacteriales bacterium OttesenSCG-928-A19]